jgi:hypothetical protein
MTPPIEQVRVEEASKAGLPCTKVFSFAPSQQEAKDGEQGPFSTLHFPKGITLVPAAVSPSFNTAFSFTYIQ